jgi:hypothetical protein
VRRLGKKSLSFEKRILLVVQLFQRLPHIYFHYSHGFCSLVDSFRLQFLEKKLRVSAWHLLQDWVIHHTEEKRSGDSFCTSRR